jgi:hypothetical protein
MMFFLWPTTYSQRKKKFPKSPLTLTVSGDFGYFYNRATSLGEERSDGVG